MQHHPRLRALVCFSLCLPAGCSSLPSRKQAVEAPAVQSVTAAKVEMPSTFPPAKTILKSGTGDKAAVDVSKWESPVEWSRKVVLTSGVEGHSKIEEPEPTEAGTASPRVFPVDNDSGPELPPAVPAKEEPLLTSRIGDPLKEEEPTAYTLNLGDVISLADQQNPNVNLARERINEAYAFVERADVLWVPSLRSGMNINHHEGAIQDADGRMKDTSKGAWYGGMGAFGVGANSPAVPGIIAQFQMTDAIFQPKIMRHQAASREFGATAVRNDTLRSTAVAYLELVRTEHALAITNEQFENTRTLVDVTEQFAKSGQGLMSDYERMLAELALRRTEVISRQEAVRVASARLAQFLHADPAVPITSGEPAVVPLPLMDHDLPARSYVVTGLARRPELSEQRQLICEAVERLNREIYAPLIPSVILGASYGGMGGGLGGTLADKGGRLDMDAVAFWEIRNLGFGEQAARQAMSSGVRQAEQRQLAVLDQVAREVVETYTQVNERQRRIEVARDGVIAAQSSYKLNLQRSENLQGLPIESLQAVQALAQSRLTYLNAVVDYNVAQMEFVRATGWFEQPR